MEAACFSETSVHYYQTMLTVLFLVNHRENLQSYQRKVCS